MAYPMQMPPRMPMPMQMPMQMPRPMPMGRPNYQSSDSTGIILLFLCFLISIVFAGGLYYLQSQSTDETSETDCSIHNDDESLCNSSDNCYWDNDLFSCETSLDDNSDNTNYENSTVTEETILVTGTNADVPKCFENERVKNNLCIPCSSYPDGSQKSTKRAGDDPNGSDTKCIESPCKENYHVHNESCVKCTGNTTRPAGDSPYSGDTVCMRPTCGLNQRILCTAPEDPLFGDIASAFATNEPSQCNINNELWEEYCEGNSTLNDSGEVINCPSGCRYIEESISDTEIQSSCIPNTRVIPGCSDFDGTRENCESISNLCLYVPSTEEQNSIDEKSRQSVARCNCEDCSIGMESEILHDISPDDDNSETTQCVVQGVGASTLYPCKSTQKADNGQCIDCPGPNNLNEPSDVQMYGCPTNRNSPQPGSPDCIHSHPPSALPVNYTGNVCRRPPCLDYEKLSGDSLDGFTCENCGIDEIGNANMSSKEHTISPDLAIDIDTTVCSTSQQLQQMVSDYCSPHDMNSEWKYEEYSVWSNSEYAVESNKDNWLPTHQYLRESMNNFKNDDGSNMTNKDVYFPSFIHPKYKYSYLKNGIWIHLCDCPTSTDQAHKENGFVNCKCSQSQYLEHSLTGSESDTCKNIESSCYANGNYFDRLKMVEGQFWNIKDPFCNFFRSNQSIDDEDIQERCCVGCSHKVYKGGVPDEDNKYGNNPPDYASNWYNQRSSTGAEKSTIRYDSTWDPILIESDTGVKGNWRNHDLSIGFNSRPLYFYPKLTGTSDPYDQNSNGDGGTQIDFSKSRDAIKTGNGSFADEDFRGDDGCGQGNCDSKGINRWMTSNIFTCKRTDPNSSQDENLSIPTYAAVGDEPFYDIKGKSTVNKTKLENAKNDFSLEYPGRKKWIRNTGLRNYSTPIKQSVLKGKKKQLSNEQVDQGVNDIVSNGVFTVGDVSPHEDYTLIDSNRIWRYVTSGTNENASGESLDCEDNYSLSQAYDNCDNNEECWGFWKYHPVNTNTRTCFKGAGSSSHSIHPYYSDTRYGGSNIAKKSYLNDNYKQLYTGGHPVNYKPSGFFGDTHGSFKIGDGTKQVSHSHCVNLIDGSSTWHDNTPWTEEEMVDQCAAICSSERINSDLWERPEGMASHINRQCESFWIGTEGGHKGKCCTKAPGISNYKHGASSAGLYFERTSEPKEVG